jgi:Fic family protein
VENLIDYAGGDCDLDPLIDCAVLHYQFEAIHPFEDGNGRIGRLLIPRYLMQKRIIEEPILYLSAFFERHINDYVGLMRRVSTHGDWEAWILFFLRAIRAQADESKTRARKVLGLHEKYRELVRTGAKSKAPLSAVDIVMRKLVVSARDVEEFARCTYPTARSALRILTGLGIVEPYRQGYPQFWIARVLLEEVYDSPTAREGD